MKIPDIKVGDKLLCKKNLYNSIIRFYKNRYYTVFDIENYIDMNDYTYYIGNNISWSFFSEDLLLEHFYNKNDIRKMKLKKLYEESES